MNPDSIREARDLFRRARQLGARARGVRIVVCPPAPYLGFWNGDTSRVTLGAQDSHQETAGAVTGGISPIALRSVGATYVILGHSERRAAGETSELIAQKIRAATRAGLTVIVCLGESKRDADGSYLKELAELVTATFQGVERRRARQVIIAYEPLWAIGSAASGADTPESFREHAIFIRRTLSRAWGQEARRIPVLYGGSVSAKNAAGFLVDGRAGGLLIGRASLSPKEFEKIVMVAQQSQLRRS